jgi:hypothetical protein
LGGERRIDASARPLVRERRTRTGDAARSTAALSGI